MPADDQWLYHVTSKTVAKIIQEKGLKSALLRLGRAVASPTGSFARDRQVKEPKAAESRLASYIADVMSRGSDEQAIRQAKGVYVPFAFTTTGSNDDFLRLTPLENSALQTYNVALRNVPRDNGKARAAKARAAVLAKELMGDKLHSLTRLAVQVTSWTFNIEETITASHVYFLTPGYAVVGYNDYTKGMHADSIVVLRVRRDNVTNLVQDEADFRALRTRDAVGADKFMLMAPTSRFIELDYRCNAGNWVALADWAG